MKNKTKSKARPELKNRTKEEIQNEFNFLCAKAGETQYKIEVLKQDLAQLNLFIQDLNNEVKEREKNEKDIPKS